MKKSSHQTSSTDDDMVVTPGGPRPASVVRVVPPGSAVQRISQGPIRIAPPPPHPVSRLTAGYVVTPGGPRPQSLVHQIRPGQAITKAAGKLAVLDLATQQTVALPTQPALAGPLPALGSGWICYAMWTRTGLTINSFSTSWCVPPGPKTQSGQVIYLFNGMEDSPTTLIVQPVLQWGSAANGGGNYWVVSNWLVDVSGPAFYTAPVAVNEGDRLTGVITLTGQSASGFSYTSEFQGIPGTSLPVLNIPELVVLAETLECYGIQVCTDYPSTDRTTMDQIAIASAAGSVTPNFTATNAVSDCGQSASVVSNAPSKGRVDLFYGNAAATPLVTGTASLLESSFRGDASRPGNLEILVMQGNGLFHYWRDDSDPALPWYSSVQVSGAVTGPACMIESSFRGDASRPGNFDVLVLEGNNLVHYWRDNTDLALPWNRGVIVSGAATGPACMIESSFRGDASRPGNFDALVLEGNNLVHYWRDNTDPALPWNRGVIVSGAATGPATMIESSFRGDASRPGNFEALVLEGNNLVHYWRDNTDPALPWNRGVIVSGAATGPATMIEGSFRGDASRPGNFEACVQEGNACGQGENLVHYWRDNTDPALPWRRSVVV